MEEKSLVAIEKDGVPRADSRKIAKELGIDHRSFFAMIKRYQDEIEKDFNQVRFENAVGRRLQGGGNPQKYAKLTEDQSYAYLAYSDNTEQSRACKRKLIKNFASARTQLSTALEELKHPTPKAKKTKPVKPEPKPVERIGPEPPFTDPRFAVQWASEVKELLEVGDDSILTKALFDYLLWMNEPISLTRIRKDCVALAKVPRAVEAETLDMMAYMGDIEGKKVKNELLYSIPGFRKPPEMGLAVYEE